MPVTPELSRPVPAVLRGVERVPIPRQTLDPQLMRPTDESAEEIEDHGPEQTGTTRRYGSLD